MQRIVFFSSFFPYIKSMDGAWCGNCNAAYIILKSRLKYERCSVRYRYEPGQCGIWTSVDSDKHVQPPFKLRNFKWCPVSSLTLIEYSNGKQKLWSDCAYAQADLRLCWSHIPNCWKSYATAQIYEICNLNDDRQCNEGVTVVFVFIKPINPCTKLLIRFATFCL